MIVSSFAENVYCGKPLTGTLYLNNFFSLLLALNFLHKKWYRCKHLKIAWHQPVKGSNQLNKIKHVKQEQARKICNHLEALHISKMCTPKGSIKCLKKLCFTGKRCSQRSTYKLRLYTQVLDVGKKSEFSQNSIEGCILKTKTGCSSVPVTNLSTWPRVTFPLLPTA